MDLSTFTSLVIAVAVFSGFAVSAYYHKKQKDSNDADLMLKISNEISTREDKADKVTNYDELTQWTIDYSNYLEVIANMLTTGKLDKSYGELFKNHLVDAYYSALFIDKGNTGYKLLEQLTNLKKYVEEKDEKLTVLCSTESIFQRLKVKDTHAK